MSVKVKMVENLDKSINAGITYKKLPKFGPRDVFERWSRNLKTELGTIPLCGKRLQYGHLQNPRSRPNIFMEEARHLSLSPVASGGYGAAGSGPLAVRRSEGQAGGVQEATTAL